MPRRRTQRAPACQMDQAFFNRLEKAGCLSYLEEHRNAFRLRAQSWNELPELSAAYKHAIGRSRLADIRRDALERLQNDERERMLDRGLIYTNEMARKLRLPRSVNLHALINGLLTDFEAAGGKFSAAKDEHGRVFGPAAEYLRVAYDALAFEGRSITRDGFARLAIEAYREPLAKARLSKNNYLERTANAWKPDG